MNREQDKQLSHGVRCAIAVNNAMGSWKFIGGMLLFFTAWIAWNMVPFTRGHFDPYPFPLLSTGINMAGMFTAPLLLMAGNVQQKRDSQKMDDEMAMTREVDDRDLKILTILEAMQAHVEANPPQEGEAKS